ncbi:hypothetical protein ES703_45621 [subsurface metagenome]
MDRMTSLFGYFHAGLLVLPFFISLFLTSKVIKRFGIRLTLLFFPLMLLLCACGIYVWPIFYLAIAIKASDKSLSFSLNQFTRELLYIPISPELKYKAKVFIDMFLNRFAKGLGALLLMIFLLPGFRVVESQDPSIDANVSEKTSAVEKTKALDKPEMLETLDGESEADESQEAPEEELPDKRILIVKIVSGFSVLFILAWIFFNLKVSKEYTKTIKKKLEIKWDRADRLVAEKVDVDYTKLVFDTIESKNRSSVLYAMNVFDLIKK